MNESQSNLKQQEEKLNEVNEAYENLKNAPPVILQQPLDVKEDVIEENKVEDKVEVNETKQEVKQEEIKEEIKEESNEAKTSGVPENKQEEKTDISSENTVKEVPIDSEDNLNYHLFCWISLALKLDVASRNMNVKDFDRLTVYNQLMNDKVPYNEWNKTILKILESEAKK